MILRIGWLPIFYSLHYFVDSQEWTKAIIHMCDPSIQNTCGRYGWCEARKGGNSVSKTKRPKKALKEVNYGPCQDVFKSCVKWSADDRCFWARNSTSFFLDNCSKSCEECKGDGKKLNLALPPMLEPLAWLVGRWEAKTSSGQRFPVPLSGPYQEILDVQIAEVPAFDRPGINIRCKMSPQSKRARRMEDEQDETTAKKNFSSLPVPLRQLVLSKTDTDTRLKLFQINDALREWVLKEELFGEDLEEFSLWNSKVVLLPRYGSQHEIHLDDEDPVFERNVFKVVRRCNLIVFEVYGLDYDFTFAVTFPRLQSINYFGSEMNLAELSHVFMGTAIQITGFFSLNFDEESIPEDPRSRENFLQFIQNHLQRCKTVNFGRYSLEKLFDFLGTQRFPQAIFEYPCSSHDGVPGFERDLKMILSDGIPSLYSDSAIWMIIREDGVGGLVRMVRIISEGTGVVMEHEAIRNKFRVAYEKVGGSLISDPCSADLIPFVDLSDVEFFGLKMKFDDKRNLIFLVYATKVDDEDTNNIDCTNIHVKFDPIEE